MKWFLVYVLCLFSFLGKTQAFLHIKITNAGEICYLAGNINGWNPADKKYRFASNGELTIRVKPNTSIEYKITKGDWSKVECRFNGDDIPNRMLTVSHDTSISIAIEGWKDVLTKFPVKQHTASAQVAVLDTAFPMRSLGRFRTIHIYLPKDYDQSSKRYPVLYMHDGQNVFDAATSFSGEWQVDETMDRVYDSCGLSMIVVAIENGQQHRSLEYNPYDHEQFGKGEGQQYVSFLVDQLKPFIDSSLRTLKAKEYTSIAGSSMGGLISMYAMLAYPDVFGYAGVFSPAFWLAPSIYTEAKEKASLIKDESIFFYAGGDESKSMLSDMEKMNSLLVHTPAVKTKLLIDEKAQHNEAAWAKYFPLFFIWLLQQQTASQ